MRVDLDTFRLTPELNEQTFEDPWQATLFAMTVDMSRRGHFSWAEWVERFSSGLKTHGDDLSLATYFQTWLETFSKLIDEKAGIDGGLLAETADHWHRSYLATPHGQPVELCTTLPATRRVADHDDHHHHHHHHEPGASITPKPAYVDQPRQAGA